MRILLQAQARSRADGNRLPVVRPPATVNRVFAHCGVESILPLGD